jgi:hypothetical protein
MKKTTLLLFSLVVISAMLIAGCTTPTTTPPATTVATPVPTTAAVKPTATVAPVVTPHVVNDGLTGSAMITEDKSKAVMTAHSGLRNLSFCELITGTGDGAGALYGSAKLNQPGDPCPERLWTTLDPAQVMKQYNFTRADKNPPYGPNPPYGRKFWTLDILELPTSTNIRLFNSDLQMAWWADVEAETEIIPYNPMVVGRNSVITFQKGNTVNLLTDPNGPTWIQKNYVSTPQAPMTYEQLPTLKTLLKYPTNWTFRTETLDQDLILKAVNGSARIMWDDRAQSWDALDPGVANYQP